MKHVNLYAKVGRAAQVCIGTFEVPQKQTNTESAAADAVQSDHLAKAVQSGVDARRVVYTREVVDVDALIAKDAAEKAAAAKKGA